MTFTLIDIVLLIVVVALAVAVFVFWQRSTQNTQKGEQELLRAQQELTRAQAEIGRAQREGEKAQREAQMLLDSAKEKGQTLLNTAQTEAKNLRDTALQEAERIRRQAEERTKAQAQEERQRLELALKNDRDALKRDQDRIAADFVSLKAEREEAKREADRLARRSEQLDARAVKLDEQEEKLDVFEKTLQQRESGLAGRERQIDLKLQEVAGLTREDARNLLLGRLEEELEEERALRVKASMEKARLEVKRESQKILVQAMQRQASETAASLAVSVVPIPSDAMKGRIIGREGRNIRTFESLTGVDLIIDDTPEAVLLSSFNPIRREIAKMALEQLVGDGRIHPSRIEEVVEKAKNEMKTYIYERGEEAALEAGVVGLKPGLVQLLGRLHFRSSYGQNVLKHSIQVAHLSGIMASELGMDTGMARRAGLLHDIGKSVDREIEGTHIEIGITLASRFAEPKEVIDAIAHHHDPENGETLYSVLAAAADAISAARPGARRESLEEYIQRLEQLERIAISFPGVDNAFAVQAGREVRVIVKPEKITDAKATLLAREIAGRIERDMNYPGQVQVTVVRESRAVEFAK